MQHKMWIWFLAGWALSMVISPSHVFGMFKAKASA